MKLCYIIGPLRAEDVYDRIKNIRRAEEAAVILWASGFAVICPHLNTGLLSGICDENTFLQGDLEILKHCDFAVTVGNWRLSSGSVGEVDFCNKHNIPVYIDVTEAQVKEGWFPT